MHQTQRRINETHRINYTTKTRHTRRYSDAAYYQALEMSENKSQNECQETYLDVFISYNWGVISPHAEQHGFKLVWWQLNYCNVTVNSVTLLPQTLLFLHNPLSVRSFFSVPLSAPLIFRRPCLSFSPSSYRHSQASLTLTWSTHIFPWFSMLLSSCQSRRLYGPHPSASHARIYGRWSPNLITLNQSYGSRPLGHCGNVMDEHPCPHPPPPPPHPLFSCHLPPPPPSSLILYSPPFIPSWFFLRLPVSPVRLVCPSWLVIHSQPTEICLPKINKEDSLKEMCTCTHIHSHGHELIIHRWCM